MVKSNIRCHQWGNRICLSIHQQSRKRVLDNLCSSLSNWMTYYWSLNSRKSRLIVLSLMRPLMMRLLNQEATGGTTCLLVVQAWASRIARHRSSRIWDSLSLSSLPSFILSRLRKASLQVLCLTRSSKNQVKKPLSSNSKSFYRWLQCNNTNTLLIQMQNLQRLETPPVGNISPLDRRPCRTSPWLKSLRPKCPTLTQLERFSTTLVKSLTVQARRKKTLEKVLKREATLTKSSPT